MGQPEEPLWGMLRLTFECVADAMGWITRAEAQAKVLSESSSTCIFVSIKPGRVGCVAPPLRGTREILPPPGGPSTGRSSPQRYEVGAHRTPGGEPVVKIGGLVLRPLNPRGETDRQTTGLVCPGGRSSQSWIPTGGFNRGKQPTLPGLTLRKA